MWITAYNIIICVLALIAAPVLAAACLFSEKRRHSLPPRLGLQKYPARDKPIWVHALSVGEMNAAIPLIRALSAKWPDRSIAVSASTKTGYENACRILKDEADVFYYPFDLPFCVSRALGQVPPGACIIVESDIWPNFISMAKARQIPVMLVNGRLSDSSLKGYRLFSGLMAPVFSSFDRVCVQSQKERDRFIEAGVPSKNLVVTGSLKFDIDGIETAAAPFSRTGSPLIVAGSTHPGEEEIFADLLKSWKDNHGARLIIAPRNPKRAGEASGIFQRAGFSTQMYSKADGAADVIVVDVMGELMQVYSRADICFVGGSLKPHGGHNPLEPAYFARPVIFGPDMSDFSAISDLLLESGGAVQVQDSPSLDKAVDELLADPKKSEAMGMNARKVVDENRGAVAKTISAIEDLL